MTEPYTAFRYLTPPRTEVKLDGAMLPRYELQHFIAQIKRNGTRSVIFVPPDRKVFAWNRHGEPHRAWKFNDDSARIFAAIPGRAWWVFDGELLHNKTPHIKNFHYLYDVLVADGVHLTSTTYMERYERLRDVLGKGYEELGQYRLDPCTGIAMNFTEGFVDLFRSLTRVEDEGVVCKLPTGIYRTSKADMWMAKFLVRKPK